LSLGRRSEDPNPDGNAESDWRRRVLNEGACHLPGPDPWTRKESVMAR